MSRWSCCRQDVLAINFSMVLLPTRCPKLLRECCKVLDCAVADNMSLLSIYFVASPGIFLRLGRGTQGHHRELDRTSIVHRGLRHDPTIRTYRYTYGHTYIRRQNHRELYSKDILSAAEHSRTLQHSDNFTALTEQLRTSRRQQTHRDIYSTASDISSATDPSRNLQRGHLVGNRALLTAGATCGQQNQRTNYRTPFLC